MPCTTNQSSVAKAWQEFDEAGRMKPGPFRERVVDVMEEHIKFTRLMRARRADFPVDREMTARLPEIAREPTSSSIGTRSGKRLRTRASCSLKRRKRAPSSSRARSREGARGEMCFVICLAYTVLCRRRHGGSGHRRPQAQCRVPQDRPPRSVCSASPGGSLPSRESIVPRDA